MQRQVKVANNSSEQDLDDLEFAFKAIDYYLKLRTEKLDSIKKDSINIE